MDGEPARGEVASRHGDIHVSVEILERFYEAFSQRDPATMAECYHPQARFSDPVFTDLRGDEIGAMWKMLIEQGPDLEVTYADLSSNGDTGSARWEARYSFGKDRRPVHNRIEAAFVFADGKILAHDDDFDLWAWTRQALGPTGTLLGWSPMVKTQVREQADAGLREWMAER